MWSVVVCDSGKKEREQILLFVRRFGDEMKWEVTVKGCADWPELYETLKQGEPDVIIIAQDGVEGLNTITNIHLSPRKFIWFSDLDFGVQAYRMCLAWFGSKPVTYQKMAQAVTQIMETGVKKGD